MSKHESNRAKLKVSAILLDFRNRNERFMYKHKGLAYIRWGKLEKELHLIVDALAQLCQPKEKEDE